MTNEEKLNDLKNRISMELKDATLQQGFEIICKRLAELEKENKPLKWEITQILEDNDYYQEENKRLEKENAELKAQIEKMKCCGNCKHWIENLDDQGEPYFSCEAHCENYDEWEDVGAWGGTVPSPSEFHYQEFKDIGVN